ncbi:MAG: transcriptional regulator [Candidatus Dormibacteria bacterium]|jgi:proteasome accessory factor B
MPARAGYSTGDKFIRVIDLLDRLGNTRVGLTTAELAEAFEVNVRSAQRYIRQLRDDVGLDIVAVDGRYKLGEGTRLPALQLDRDQATALLIAVRLLQQLYPDRDPALVGAMARLAAALKVPTVTDLLGRFIETVEKRPEDPIALQLHRTVVEAFTGQLKLEIEYTDAQVHGSRRVVHPYFLEPRSESRTIYVFAHDEASATVRLFRLDRISHARVIRERFEPSTDFDVDALVSGSWGIWQAQGHDEVVLRLTPEAAARVRQSFWHPSAQLSDLEDRGVELRLTVASEVEMRPWVLGWGGQVEVLAPPSLREHVAGSMLAGARLYAGG